MASPEHNPRLISVLIPVRNGGYPFRELLTRLQSLPVPSGFSLEIVVGYQESSDDTAAVIQEMGVRMVHCAGLGPSANRNAAAGAARGQLLVFIDADAQPARDDFLFEVVRSAKALKRFGAFEGPILLHPSQRWNPIAFADHLACWYVWHEKRPSGYSEFQPTVTLVTTAQAFHAVGGFNLDLQVLEDYDFELRLRKGDARSGKKMPPLPIAFMQSLPVHHRARGCLWHSVRHSWHWGWPAREAFYLRSGRTRYPFAEDRRLFWINLPRLLFDRLRTVLKVGWALAPGRTALALPFIVVTVFAWALAVVVGGQAEDRPRAAGR